MKKIIGFITLFLLQYSTNAQVILKGNIRASNDEPVPFMNVAIYHIPDTTKLVAGSITDTQGNYVLTPVKTGKYRIIASAIGYRTIEMTMLLDMPPVGNIITKNFTTDEEVTNLDEVLVKANRKNNYVDKSIYTFSKEQIKKARQAHNLLTNIGEISIDMTTNKIEKTGGGDIQILINGINASDNDLKNIPADKVLKVEYYDIPPARYATVSALVNIITKRLDIGWSGGVDAFHAFTTGFANDDLFLKYISGNHQISLDYELRYRNYNDRSTTDIYRYQLDEKNMEHIYRDKDKFGYTKNNINLKSTYNKPDNYTLQIVLSPNFSSNFAKGNSEKGTTINEIQQQGIKNHDNSIRSFGPTADIYFSKQLKNNQELTLDLVGTYYHNKQERLNRETDVKTNNLTLEDCMNLCNNKKSLIGEMAYTKLWGKGSKLSIGYKMTLASSNSTISNYLSDGQQYTYNSENNKHYFYAEYGNTSGKFMYRIGAGGTHITTRNDDTRFSQMQLTPKLILGYKLSSNHNLQWVLTSSPIIPSISQLNNNAKLITNELIHQGNPYLHSGKRYLTTFKYSQNNKWIDFSLTAMVTYEKNPINTYYQEGNINNKKYIISTSENAKSFLQYGGSYSFTLCPLRNETVLIKLYGIIRNQKLDSPIVGKFSHWYTPLFYSLDFQKGKWKASYSGKVVSKQLNGSYIDQDENRSHLLISYQCKNLEITAGCYWLFTKSKYFQETLPNDILQHTQWTSINDNRSMLVLGLNWSFSTGRNINIKRKIQNKDTDKGTF